MQKTLAIFQEQVEQARGILHKTQAFLQEGEELGVKIDPAWKNKIKEAMQTQGSKLKVALIGGFSEGKTSIAAAWLEKLDRSSMKITHEESSDEIKVYDVDGQITLVDTPGLFGFKEKLNADTHQIEKYKDITKKHVSEAHLILYVMNPILPIKDSHRADLHWLFRDLDLLPRSIFVLSKFDEVANVEDEQDYAQSLQTKKDMVSDKLKAFVGLSDAELSDLCVVAVAANPFDLGIETWLQEPEQFKQLSHIACLQQATEQKIETSGGVSALSLEAQISVMRDLLHAYLPQSKEMFESIDTSVAHSQKILQDFSRDLNQLERDAKNARINLRTFVAEYFSDLIMQVQGSNVETINEFLIREVGEEGVNIETKIKNRFEQEAQAVNLQMQRVASELLEETSSFEKILGTYAPKGLDFLAKTGGITNKTVIATRDIITGGLGKLGFDLSWKFRPWEAIKLANKANAFFAVLGLGLQAWDTWKRLEKEEDFQKAKKKLEENFNKQKKEILETIDAPDFMERFFPSYVSLCQQIQDREKQLKELTQKQEDFKAWLECGQKMLKEVELLSTH
ncbi:LeoA protein [Helicobacter bizzozeronii]|uniref:LeoA/HP0731 family dynamin-like GTPase n=1 Tax=Helicobacter bizzozeronii TaxID=56877 RepID=UPI000CEE216B|nr:LeoA/HP0731 family dynamin-like GTPase [Helicobacter bizzozeronii]GMB92749.1 LeoA protein [Helicobacter bizzozeronii]